MWIQFVGDQPNENMPKPKKNGSLPPKKKKLAAAAEFEPKKAYAPGKPKPATPKFKGPKQVGTTANVSKPAGPKTADRKPKREKPKVTSVV